METDRGSTQKSMVLMENIPKNIFRKCAIGFDRVQQVVPEYKNKTNDGDHSGWQKYQSGQNDHTDSDRPDHLQDAETVRDVESPGEVDDDEFGKDQPQSARE